MTEEPKQTKTTPCLYQGIVLSVKILFIRMIQSKD